MIKIIIFLFFVTLSAVLLKSNKKMALYGIFFYQQLTAMISLYLIEDGGYISEQRIYGFDIDAFYVYVAFSFATLITFYYSLKFINFSFADETKPYRFLFVCIAYFLLFISGQGFDTDYNRFSIFQGSDLYTKIFSYATVMFQGFYLYTILREPDSKLRFFYLFLMMVICYFRGEEFGGYFISAVFFFWGYISRVSFYSKKGLSLEIAFTCLVLCAVICGAVYYKYLQLDEVRFMNRVVNQAHTFWGAVYLDQIDSFRFNVNEFLQNFFDISKPRVLTDDFGLGKLEFNIAGDLASDFHQSGVRFAIGYPSILIYEFNLATAFVLNCAVIFLYTRYINFINCAVSEYGPLFFALLFKITEPVADFVYSGEYANLNMKIVIALAVLYLFRLALQHRQNQCNFKIF